MTGYLEGCLSGLVNWNWEVDTNTGWEEDSPLHAGHTWPGSAWAVMWQRKNLKLTLMPNASHYIWRLEAGGNLSGSISTLSLWEPIQKGILRRLHQPAARDKKIKKNCISDPISPFLLYFFLLLSLSLSQFFFTGHTFMQRKNIKLSNLLLSICQEMFLQRITFTFTLMVRGVVQSVLHNVQWI